MILRIAGGYDNDRYTHEMLLNLGNTSKQTILRKHSHIDRSPHRTGPHRTGPHRTGPHRTGPHRTGRRGCIAIGNAAKAQTAHVIDTEPVDEAVLRTEWVGSPVIGESVDTEPVDEAAPGVHDPPEQTMSEAEL